MATVEFFKALLNLQTSDPTPEILLSSPVDALARAIENLEAKQRVMLSLVYLEDLAPAVIAQILGVDAQDVRATAEQAVAILSKELRKDTSENSNSSSVEHLGWQA